MKEIFNQTYQLVNQYSSIQKNDIEELLTIANVKKFKKNEHWLKKNDMSYHEGLVLDGVIRGYHINTEGEEINTVFYETENAIAPWFSRTRNQKSILNYQFLKDTTILEFSASEFYELMGKNMSIRAFGQKVVENELYYRMEKEIMSISLDAKQRYEKFHEMHPGLENKISQIHIAQFLGITPVSLSRLRSKN